MLERAPRARLPSDAVFRSVGPGWCSTSSPVIALPALDAAAVSRRFLGRRSSHRDVLVRDPDTASEGRTPTPPFAQTLIERSWSEGQVSAAAPCSADRRRTGAP